MVVRGAPAIGCAAAYGLALSADDFEEARETLLRRSPDGGQPALGLERMANVKPRTFDALKAEADKVLEKISRPARRSAGTARNSFPENRGILTHCNAGGLGDVRLRHRAGRDPRRAGRGKTMRDLRRRDAPLAPGRAADRVGALAGRHFR